MADAAAYRGPDGIETWSGPHASIVHLALNVTASDERESQPLVEGPLVLVADARIDNRSALQSKLRTSLRSSTPTDAELILAAYQRWGTDCLEHLIGDFAFAIWDQNEQRLFAARDPMGMRPFHYRIEEERVLFGSDVKQLLAAPNVPARVSEPMIAAYLQKQFQPLDWTFYEGIFQLKPAHALLVHPDGSSNTWRHWDIDPSERIRYDYERDYVEHFREVFAEAVRDRLRSTEPVGLFLSGGVDSGSIASMAGHLKETEGIGCPTLRTYSWAFETLTQCDERDVSSLITDRYDFPSTPIDAESVRLIGPPNGVPDRDSPLMSHYQALLTRGLKHGQAQGVRCVLNGQNGDLLTGSWIFDNLALLRKGELWTLWNELRAQQETLGRSMTDLLRRSLYQPIRKQFWPQDTLPWLRKPLKRAWNAVQPNDTSRSGDAPSPRWMSNALSDVDTPPSHRTVPAGLKEHGRKRRYRAITVPLQRRMGTWSERLYSRHEVTCADPWADRRLIEYVMAIPQDQICRNGQNKYITREAMRGIMPEKARQSLNKVSPAPLYDRALKDEEERIRSFINLDTPYVYNKQMRQHYGSRIQSGPEDFRFWLTLCLKMWLSHHEIGTSSKNPKAS
jgi:asparagine synthase (glutamine-hydrolysing)